MIVNSIHNHALRFSITAYAAWAPGIETEADWRAWANGDLAIAAKGEPAVKAMPAMLRRRASVPGRMALEVAYRCLGERTHIPAIFCSRHGECGRAADLLTDLASNNPLSPTVFSLSVHNATGGLFAIARHDRANSLALAAGAGTIEHAVIEACGLLADNTPAVLLVAYDNWLPSLFTSFQSCNEQPYAWAWLLQPPGAEAISLSWSATQETSAVNVENDPPGLEILRFFIRKDANLKRIGNGRCWQWASHA